MNAFPSSYGWLMETGATYIENVVILAAVTRASGVKRAAKVHIPLLFLFSVCTTILVAILNGMQTFSYLTPLLSMAFVIFISSRILSRGSLLTRSIAAILSYLMIQCLDYIVVILLGHCLGKTDDFFTVFVSTSGMHRLTFLAVDKSLDVVLYLLLSRHLPGLSKLTPRLRGYLLVLSAISYAVMQVLFHVVLLPSLPMMQLAVVASWCFLMGFIVALIAFFLSLTKQEQARQRMEMLHLENVLMMENYQKLHLTQQSYAKTLHDFKHHIMTVQELVRTGKTESATAYLQSLLATSYQQAAQCHSGHDMIDAIINSKLSEAQAKQIRFTFLTNLHHPIGMDPVDLCGVLANQLENAFEACIQIPNPAGRHVHVDIKQAQSFVFFKVENTVVSNPFAHNPHLRSTKPPSAQLHGYGLRNMESIAQKYEGSVRSEYKNGRFVSVVSLCDPSHADSQEKA